MIGFALSVLMGAGLVALLATVRPEWSPHARRYTAALALPAITVIATGFGVLFILFGNHDATGQMKDLAISALIAIGGGFTFLSLAGGLIGATLASRRHR